MKMLNLVSIWVGILLEVIYIERSVVSSIKIVTNLNWAYTVKENHIGGYRDRDRQTDRYKDTDSVTFIEE